HHVANKEALLDGLVERFVLEIELPRPDEGWRDGMWRRATSARAAFRRHPWALTLLESRRNPGPATLRYHDAVLGCMLRDGFSIELAGHAFALVDAFVFGFAVQEATLPFENGADLEDVAADVQAAMPADELPHLAAMIAYSLRPGYAFAAEFDYGLTLILDGLELRRAGR
ncbi:MAG: TetR/AcrR family transcriptional regulator C-terminal domain-containing protein, partial [Myxococcales bacterium]|nr:TetR/AcrR family transcriptional regulator C-terminal domain-containing protein [Myxococcales bacterium]